MQKRIKQKGNGLLGNTSTSNSLELVSRFRSSSNRKIKSSSRKFQNLSLVRTPSNLLKKQNNHFLLPPHKKLKAVSQSLAFRLKSSSPNSYFNECRKALNELSTHPHPISQVLIQIQAAYEQKLTSLQSSQSIESSPPTNHHLTSESPSLQNRIQIRRYSSRRNDLVRERKSDSASIPKLKMNYLKGKEESGKPTEPTTETSKYIFQDYQDEFMSKFNEFSESWRKQILLQGNSGIV